MTPSILPRGPLSLALHNLQSQTARGRSSRAAGTLTRRTTRGVLTSAHGGAGSSITRKQVAARWA